MLTRIINSGGGLASLFLITRYMSQVQTGYYYAFLSLIGFQVFFEIGLSTIIVQRATQLVADINWRGSCLSGNYQRLANYFKQSSVIILLLTVAMVFSLSLLGARILFDHSSSVSSPQLLLLWLVCVALTGLTMVIAFLCNFLEGCGKVREVAVIRLWQSAIGLIALWSAIIFGFNVFGLGLQLFVTSSIGLFFIFYYFKNLFIQLWKRGNSAKIVERLKNEWPFQWRLSVSFLGAYFSNQVFVAISSLSGNLTLAGKVGIALQILTSITGFSATPVTSRFPIFGILIGKGEYQKFRETFRRAINFSYLLLFIFIVIFWLAVAVAYYLSLFDFNRLLSFKSGLLLTGGLVANHIFISLNVNIQSRGRDNFYIISIVRIVFVGLAVLFFKNSFDEVGVVLTYLLSSLLSLFLAVLIYKKQKYHF